MPGEAEANQGHLGELQSAQTRFLLLLFFQWVLLKLHFQHKASIIWKNSITSAIIACFSYLSRLYYSEHGCSISHVKALGLDV